MKIKRCWQRRKETWYQNTGWKKNLFETWWTWPNFSHRRNLGFDQWSLIYCDVIMRDWSLIRLSIRYQFFQKNCLFRIFHKKIPHFTNKSQKLRGQFNELDVSLKNKKNREMWGYIENGTKTRKIFSWVFNSIMWRKFSNFFQKKKWSLQLNLLN